MVDSIQPAGSSPAGKPQDAQEQSDAKSSDDLSFKEVLEKMQKAVDQGEKASEFIDRVNSSDRADLEKVLNQNKQLETVFKELFDMVDSLKETQSMFDETSLEEEGESE